MKNKITNLIIYIFVFMIIVSSFIVPDILLKMQEQDIQMAVYENDNAESHSSISVETAEIYLVKAIHDIESEDIGVIISSSEIVTKNVDNVSKVNENIEMLEESNIIKNLEFSDNSEILISIIKKVYEKGKTQYTINNTSLSIDNNDYQMDIEEKTGKIIRLITNKENLNNEIEREELLKKYIQYLDLYIIDDWVYENNIMKSQKADLEVSLVESINSGICILSIHSNSNIADNLIEYENLEN